MSGPDEDDTAPWHQAAQWQEASGCWEMEDDPEPEVPDPWLDNPIWRLLKRDEEEGR